MPETSEAKPKHPGGAPRQYSSTYEVQRIIDLYFLACKVNRADNADLLKGLPEEDLLVINDIDDLKPTVTGLAYALNLTRQGLLDYEGREEFADTIKKGKQRIEKYLEQNLYGQSVAGTIFNLKNNYGWKDKTETEFSGKLEIDQLSDIEIDARLELLLAETNEENEQ